MTSLPPSEANGKGEESRNGPNLRADSVPEPRGSYAVVRLVAIYLLISGAWILLSDRFVANAVQDPEMFHRIQTYKGWFFVTVTGVLLGWLMRRDVRQIENAAAVVKESETKFRALVEQSLTGVYIIEEGKFAYVNPRLCEIFGYSGEEMGSMNPLDTVQEHDRARVAENLRKRLTGVVESLHYSFSGRHKEGERLEVEVLGTRTEFNGRPTVIGTALDVTARKLAEEQQRRLALEKDHLIERLQLHFDAMPIGCIVMSQDLTVLDWNPAAERIFGFSRDEMMGCEPFGKIIPDASREALLECAAGWTARTASRSVVLENHTKEARRISCEWHETPLCDASGQVVGLLAMVQDVTQRLESEAALRELSARLLAAQDEERRRIARELHDTTAQHLAALSLNLATISRLLFNPPSKVEKILGDSLNLAGTAAQEVRTTAYLLHPPLLEAAGLVGAVRDYAAGFAKRSGMTVELDLPGEWQRLPREAELALFRVVQEGLTNIHRHSGSDSATIRVAQEAGLVRLELRDSGRGIPARTLAALSGKPGAVGVGIAGMRERLRQLRGHLEIESDRSGTSLIATLPTVMADPKPE